jgi:hypothetical protein
MQPYGTTKHVRPRYINTKVSGDKKRTQNTKNAAIRHRISQELRFQYAKKQQLNEQLYKTHLECATQWATILQMIQSTIDSKIQQVMEAHYNHLNKKLDQLLQNQPKKATKSTRREERHQFYTGIENLTCIRLSTEEEKLLNYGLNYSIERHTKSYATNLITETEQAIRLLDEKLQNPYRFLAAKKIKQIISATRLTNPHQKGQLYITKELNKK